VTGPYCATIWIHATVDGLALVWPAKMFWHQFQHSTVRRPNLLRLGPGNQVLQSIHRPCQESAQKDVMHCVFSAKLRSSWRDGVVQKRWPCAIRPRQWIGRD
jgi:hypothetical protein